MDLSKVFDCITHELLVAKLHAKLHAYGLKIDAATLAHSL